MPAFHKSVSYVALASMIILPLLLPMVYSSSNEAIELDIDHRKHKRNFQKMSPKLSSQVVLHGFLLWTSMGFLMPIGILVVKMLQIEKCGRRVKVLFYFHVILQILSLILATAGAVLSIRNFENAFNNNHQRIGLALYGMIWVQVVIGFFRPKRGLKQRSTWFFVHWLTGTVITIVGIMNIYTGLEAYRKRTSKSVKLWSILFTGEVCFFVFVYLLQDKWLYMKKQGVIQGDQPNKSSDQENLQKDDPKDLGPRSLTLTQAFAASGRFTNQLSTEL
ncbi:hypothetical protein ACHQM5_004765 [Ranunculus cassubicifolius]